VGRRPKVVSAVASSYLPRTNRDRSKNWKEDTRDFGHGAIVKGKKSILTLTVQLDKMLAKPEIQALNLLCRVSGVGPSAAK
jgi:hypothetical protein